MNKLILATAVSFALFAPAALAVEEHHPDQKPGATAAKPAPAPKDADKAAQQLSDNAKKLRAQADRIAKTKDPAERQKLVQEHMQTLRASMAAAAGMMGGMGGGPGAGMGMMGGGMMMDCPMMGQMMGGDATMGRMQQMEKRMDMMQMMLEQMQKQQEQKK